MALRIKTLDDRMVEVGRRREEERKMAQTVDRIHRAAEAEGNPGCGGPLCAWFARARGKAPEIAHSTLKVAAARAGSAAGTAAGKAVGTAEAVTRGMKGMKTQSSLFGQRKAKADPASKLAEAAAAMEERVAQLETRVGEQRSEAARLMKLGQKSAAMRTLKKSKALEKQLASNQSSLLAVEQQVDMLSQAHLQRTMADALHASSKGLKKDKKMLKKAEGAVEEAQEARDLADDLGQVMAEFATTGGGYDDDDDLLAELQEMVAEGDDDGGGNASDVIPGPTAQELDAAELEAKHAAYDEAERMRRALPRAPASKKREEKTQLLAVVSG